jgi:hypothetical protein
MAIMSKKYLATGALILAWIVMFIAIGEKNIQPHENIVDRRQLQVAISKVILDDDGILQVGRRPDVPPCRLFTDYNNENQITFQEGSREVRGIHFHFDDCAENQLGNRLGEHYLNC